MSRKTNVNSKKLSSSFYSGLSGLQLNIPKYRFPPLYKNASRLTYYSTLFNSIEINSTFYKLPMATTVSKWSASVNENFKFTFKMWKQITHVKGLSFEESDVELFMKTVASTEHKKGCLLLQFPPSLRIENIEQVDLLLKCISLFDKEHSWNLAVEFRHRSWYCEEVYELLNFHNAVLVTHDIPSSAPPMIKSKARFAYIQFHGPTGNYRGSYSQDFLSEYAEFLKVLLKQDKTVYVYFNNTMARLL